MATRKLTAKGVAALTADGTDRVEVWDELLPGLGLRVSGTTGRKVWVVRYRANGQHRRLKIGTYPAVSLAKAREQARDVMAKASAGEDPSLERRERKGTGRSFGAMAHEVLAAKEATLRAVTLRDYRRQLKANLLPEWQDRPAGSVTRREVVQLVERIADRAPIGGNRTLALVRLLYNEALRRDFPGVEHNPAHMVRPPRPEGRRDRFLSRDEIRAVWVATEPEAPVMRSLFRVALLTGQRIGNVAAMRWDAIVDDLWRIRAEEFKGRRPHLVPLSVGVLGAIEGLRGLDPDVVFLGPVHGKRAHVVTTSRALRRIRERTNLPHWTAHDFRTTLRTHATRAKEDGGLGVAPNVADAVLGHAENTLGWSRYQGDRDRYLLHEKRAALEYWGRFVLEAVEEAAVVT